MDIQGFLSGILQHIIEHWIEGLIAIGSSFLMIYWAKIKDKIKWSYAIFLGLGVFSFVLLLTDHFTGSNQQPTSISLGWATYKKEPVIGKMFMNEIVILDGKSFSGCMFTNVTFEFDGTAPFDLINNHISGSYFLYSKNSAIENYTSFLKEFHYLNQNVQFLTK